MSKQIIILYLQAIARLDEQMKQECDHLKTKPLDQTNREIMIDIKRSNDEIKELKKSHEHITEELKQIKTFKQDIVPRNIRGK